MDWITSDTHYNHKNIVTGVSSWPGGGQRHFNTLEEHDEMIINNINNCVKKTDRLFHLGDWSFGGKKNIVKFRAKLNCDNIFLTFGNHDEHIVKNGLIEVEENDLNRIIDIVKYKMDFKGIDHNYEQNSHYLQSIKELRAVRPQDLFLQTDHIIYQTFSVNGVKYKTVLSHWPMRVWDKCSKGAIMLHGHSHGNLQAYKNKEGKQYKTMDCGVDTNDLKPYLIDDVIKIMNTCRILNDADHHDGNHLQ